MSSTTKKTSSRSYQELRPYQRDCITRLYEHDETLVLLKVGGGKTVVGGTAFGELMDEGVLTRTLVLAPKRVALLTWPDEFQLWEHLRKYSIAVAVGTPEKRRAAVTSGAQFVVMNWENLDWLYETGLWTEFDGIIMDEVSRVMNYGAGRSKALQRMLRDFKVRVGMTGSPGNIKRLYGMTKAVDRGRRLGMNWTPFRDEFYRHVGLEHWEWEEKKGAMDKVLDRIEDVVFMITDDEYANQLPPLVENVVRVQLPPRVRDLYDELEAEMVVALDGLDLEELIESDPDNPAIIEAVNGGVLTGKLQQIVDGFLYDRNQQANPLHDEKLNALAERLEDVDEPTLVVYKFQATLAELRERFNMPVLSSTMSAKRTRETVEAWNAGELPQLAIHPQSAGHGLNIQFGGNRMMILSTPWSHEYWEQTIGRLQRSGQEGSNVFVDYFVADSTVDDDIAATQVLRGNVQKAIFDGIMRRQGL